MGTVVPGLLGLDLSSVTFEPFRAGVEIARLSGAAPSGGETALLRYAPGASVPMHEHTGLETIVVLSGAQADDDGLYVKGDVVMNAKGSRHRVWSDSGCVVLITWAAPVRILEEGS